MTVDCNCMLSNEQNHFYCHAGLRMAAIFTSSPVYSPSLPLSLSRPTLPLSTVRFIPASSYTAATWGAGVGRRWLAAAGTLLNRCKSLMQAFHWSY